MKKSIVLCSIVGSDLFNYAQNVSDGELKIFVNEGETIKDSKLAYFEPLCQNVWSACGVVEASTHDEKTKITIINIIMAHAIDQIESKTKGSNLEVQYTNIFSQGFKTYDEICDLSDKAGRYHDHDYFRKASRIFINILIKVFPDIAGLSENAKDAFINGFLNKMEGIKQQLVDDLNNMNIALLI